MLPVDTFLMCVFWDVRFKTVDDPVVLRVTP
jgi:hypothetical protein